eukprot:CAMPEP_0172527454 /NCGR_PEP_ID=MMETSP1067-20121228/2132_1 /TAXON_ID=265564 ORGANISM="Thalassiosira punctigera, Strain Tpunct2005C2" /NCGR_SAMPLE_ID=MMETSP1067 /ASSEMBLY_ACC=CAM_ASM_000444 /LENGTH=78 /DNA_ID=CAMNT_0013311197 /DNA_START=570 /DNA_END=806 /DNA_ORIENTATION=+
MAGVGAWVVALVVFVVLVKAIRRWPLLLFGSICSEGDGRCSGVNFRNDEAWAYFGQPLGNETGRIRHTQDVMKRFIAQ